MGKQNVVQTSLMGIGLSVLLMGCASSTADTSKAQNAPDVSAVQSAIAQDLPITAIAEIVGKKVQLEVANTPQEQATGLMGRTSLGDDRGMLFPFSPPRPVQFWMKNTLISLDMIFVRQGVVKAIAVDVPPCKSDPCPVYGSANEVIDQVIEVRGGRSKALGLKVGDRLPIQFLKPGQRKP
ncbi:DUF192 domain-containing protein [Phormidesmis priestleyi]